jgi:hypothetical protein
MKLYSEKDQRKTLKRKREEPLRSSRIAYITQGTGYNADTN